MNLRALDKDIIHFFQDTSIPAARFGLFVIFFWFGILKILGLSPAAQIVQDLYNQTVPFLDFHAFYICFSILECVIGLMFLIKGFERFVLPLLLIHITTTFFPLFLLTDATWQAPFVPTLEGQYIIKNLAIIAAAIGIAAHLHPLKAKE
jgi:uncharacterized membrane protein YphA (DoxX/SURF4 family)